jgi:phosphatidylserine decarboxylase
VIKKTLNPSFPEKDATFDFNIYLSIVDKLSAIELIAWDKDTIGKEYLGEAALPLEDWFLDTPGGREYAWEATQVSQFQSYHTSIP